MFKRVEKRRRKQAEEEELGLDGDLKQVLGLNDTDSEESDSSSGSEDEGGSEDGENHVFAEFPDEELEGEGEAELDDEEGFDVPIKEALREPIIVVSVQPVVKACVVCPGKSLKTEEMVTLHRKSNACTTHERRFKQFKEAAAQAEPDGSSLDIVQRRLKSKLATRPNAGESNRAAKRKARAAFLKAKRAKQKEKAKAKLKTAKKKQEAEGSPSTEPAKKKLKADGQPGQASPTKKKQKMTDTTVDEAATDKTSMKSTAASEKVVAKATISSIARSTAQRAKQARKQALTGKTKERKPGTITT